MHYFGNGKEECIDLHARGQGYHCNLKKKHMNHFSGQDAVQQCFQSSHIQIYTG
jgi:hypothetical protein